MTGPRLLGLVGTLASVLLVPSGCSDGAGAPVAVDAPVLDPGSAGALTVEVLTTVDHRTDAFTQGLVWTDEGLYESTGLVGESSLRAVDPLTGDVAEEVAVDRSVFAEGLALVGDRLVQLTWQDGVAFVYDAETFEVVDEHTYEGEGWGLCHDGERLVMSDGSAELTFRDAESFEETGQVDVTLDGAPVTRLNELECVGDRVWANVWLTDSIVEIDPTSGDVTSVVDASPLRAQLQPPVRDDQAVLNGIAHDDDAGTFWLTGKHWPQMFEVRFVPA